MVEAGIFGPRDRLFLWKGQLVEAMTQGEPHCFAMAQLNRFLVRLVPDEWFITPGRPLALPDESMPEPDFMVVCGTPRDYLHRPPNPGDVDLVVEVSDSSLAFDRGEVLPAYAAHAVPVYWIVNIPERRI
jgi:Uma2 family endonuclease